MDLTPPDICFLCGARAEHKRALCDPCRSDLPRLARPCNKCGIRLQAGSMCPACIIRPPNYDRVIAPYRYLYPVTILIKALKYRNNIEIAREFGIEIVNTIRSEARVMPEVILPVPLHPLRTMRRGFNQALEIAGIMADRLGLPLDNRLVKRVHNTLPQYNLDPAARRKNISAAFKLALSPEYRSIALVDDIITTGTTVNEIARLLKISGVKSVEVWACARAF